MLRELPFILVRFERNSTQQFKGLHTNRKVLVYKRHGSGFWHMPAKARQAKRDEGSENCWGAISDLKEQGLGICFVTRTLEVSPRAFSYVHCHINSSGIERFIHDPCETRDDDFFSASSLQHVNAGTAGGAAG